MKIFVLLQAQLYTIDGLDLIDSRIGDPDENVKKADRDHSEYRGMLFDPDYIVSIAKNIRYDGCSSVCFNNGFTYTIKGEPADVFDDIKKQIDSNKWLLLNQPQPGYGMSGDFPK